MKQKKTIYNNLHNDRMLLIITFSAIIFFLINILCVQKCRASSIKVSANTFHTLAITTTGKVSCTTSDNFYGQCSTSTWENISQVAAGKMHSVARENDGDVLCTGDNSYGQCDVGSFPANIEYIATGPYRTIAVDLAGNAYCIGKNSYDNCVLSGWNGISQVSAGGLHTVGLKTDNTVVCTGSNTYGQCDVDDWGDVIYVSAGYYFTLGLKNDGSVLFTGQNNQGQGDVSGWSNIVHISAGMYHSVAVDSTNKPYATGANNNGQCNVDSWTVISDVIAAPSNTIGVLVTGELTVIGSTETSAAVAVEEWNLINNPPDLVDVSISTFEDYSVSTIDLFSLASDYEEHTLTIIATNPIPSDGSVVNNQDGTYTYYPDTDHNGSDSFTYTITDGQTINYTGTATVSITITPVNDPPDYAGGSNQSILEDDGLQSIASWATSLTTGAYNEGSQTLSLTWTCSDESLFLTAPTLSSVTASTNSLTLTYAFSEDENGSVTLTVILSDNGGTSYLAYGAQDTITRTYTITATAVNDAPTFTKGPNLPGILADSIYHAYPYWASAVDVGAANEYTQTLTFSITDNTNPTLFSSQPAIALSGTTGVLSYTLAAGQYGDATVTVVLWDDGGTTNSGVDRITETFSISAWPIINDGPGGVADTVGNSTLQLWLKADELTGLSDGEALTSWEDANGYSISCSDCPTYSYTFTNNWPAVTFNGTSNFFEDTSTAFDFEGDPGMAVFAVMNASNENRFQTIMARDSSSDRGWGCQLNDSNQLYFSVAASDSVAVTCPGTSAASNSITLVSFIFDGVRYHDIDVYHAQTNVSDTVEYTVPYFINGDGPKFTIGKDGDDANFFSGSIAELIVYNRQLTTVERILINNYLSSKYNIALSANDKYTGDTASAGDYDLDVAGIGLDSDGINESASSAGMTITNTTFLQNQGDYLLFGHRVETNAITVTNLPSTVNMAMEREWMIHKTDTGVSGGVIQVAFDTALAGLEDLTTSTDFVLLKKSGQNGAYSILNTLSPTITDDKITFSSIPVASLNTGDCLTLGSTLNYALKFNGVDQYLISETAIDLASTSFTVEYWARRDFTTVDMYVVGQGPSSWTNFNNLNMGFTASDTIVFGIDDTNIIETTEAYTDTNWHHYAFTYNNSTGEARIFVDGVLKNTNTIGTYSGSGVLYIGLNPAETIKPFRGELDEIRIWSGIRSDIEIFSSMNDILNGDETNLLSYWQFNESVLLLARDKTASAINQTLTPTTDPPEWIESTLPMGTSASQTETIGTLSFTDTNMTMTYNYHHGETVVVSKITTPPNVLPDSSSTILDSQYWILNRTGDTTFNADFTLTSDAGFTSSGNAPLAKLFWRENGSTGSWSAIAYGADIDDGTETVYFNSIKTEGQFMIAFDNHDSVAGSGKLLYFDGLDDFAVDETNSVTLANSSFTIEFWAKKGANFSTYNIIGHSDTAQGLCIGFSATNTFEFSYDTNLATTGAYTDTDWHHWAITLDASDLTQTIYCDGVWLTENMADAAYDLTGNFYIGCGPNQTNLFKGKLDEIRVWDNVRTISQIQNNMFEPLNGDETGLIAYWRMDEPWSYTTITDVTANGINCAVTGTMLVSNWIDSTAWSERTTDEDVALTIIAGYDLEGDAFTVEGGSPLSGTASDTLIIEYSPSTNFYGTDIFSFQVPSGGTSYPLTITVNPVNDPPEITFINELIIDTNEVGSLSITITDVDNDADSLTITSASNSQLKVDDDYISISCIAESCTATITPVTDANGGVEITFTVEDPDALTATSILYLTINTYPTIGSINNYTTSMNTATSPIAFTINDIETAKIDLNLTLTSSDPGIIDIANTLFTQDVNGDCTITLTPTTSASGTVTIEIIVLDDMSFTATTSFDLLVMSIPEIEPIADYTTSVSTALSIPFLITDLDTVDLNTLSLTITSSDSGILPINQTELINSAGNCTATLTPTSTAGDVTVEITVTDTDGNYTSTTFNLNVNEPPTIDTIEDYTMTVNTIKNINFNVADNETVDGNLVLTLTCSNETILPLTQTKLSNNAGSCIFSLTPTAYSEVTVIDIVITVLDDAGYTSSTSFAFTITDMPGSGYAVSFAGSYSASTTKNISLSDHTIEAWIYPESSSYGGIVSIGTGKFTQMLITDTRKIGVDVLNDGGTVKSYTGNTVLTIDTWNHVAYTYDSTADSLTMFVNGIEESVSVSTEQALTNFTLNARLYIGVDQDESIMFDGIIDEVRVWNTVRLESDIREYMCKKIPKSSLPISLIAYYRFDQTYGNILYDLTSNDNDCNSDWSENEWDYSAAPIGDYSVYDYTGTVAQDFSATLAYGDGETFTMSVSSSVPSGIHLYSVDQEPNTTYDLYEKIESKRYWGTFIIGSCTYLVKYDYVANTHAAVPTDRDQNSLGWRYNNADLNWASYGSTSDSDEDGIIISPADNTYRVEYILYNNLK